MDLRSLWCKLRHLERSHAITSPTAIFDSAFPGAVLGAGQAEAVTEPDKTWNVKVVEGHSFTWVLRSISFPSLADLPGFTASLSLPIPDLVDYETFLVMSGFYGEVPYSDLHSFHPRSDSFDSDKRRESSSSELRGKWEHQLHVFFSTKTSHIDPASAQEVANIGSESHHPGRQILHPPLRRQSSPLQPGHQFTDFNGGP